MSRYEEVRTRKVLAMEASVAKLRAMVIGVNVLSWALFIGPNAPRAPLAIGIISVAVPYGIWSLLARPYERYPLLRFGALTLTMDVMLITLWVLGTGGAASDFWIIYVISVVSVGMRYDLRQTVGTGFAEAALYVVVMSLDGGAEALSLLVRGSYIVLSGVAAGMLARQERISRQERVLFEDLAAEHASMLSRERETVERLRQLDELRAGFVANASHELRTPLTTLAGYASVLATRFHDLSPEEVERSLAAMNRQADRTRQLIDNLLDLSKLDHDRLPITVAPVSIAASLQQALDTAPPPTGRLLDVDADDEIRVLADPSQLERVIVNLLTNAYRYGGSRISCKVRDEGTAIVLTVSDDGPGVSPANAQHLFEPFWRGDRGSAQPGSGLGLAISRRLAEGFGGSLDYEPAPGGGSRFSIAMRRAPASAAAAPQAGDPEAAEAS